MPFMHGIRDSVVTDKAVPRIKKGQMFRKCCWAKLEGINGIGIQGLKKQLHLRKERTSGRNSWQEVAKRITECSIRI